MTPWVLTSQLSTRAAELDPAPLSVYTPLAVLLSVIPPLYSSSPSKIRPLAAAPPAAGIIPAWIAVFMMPLIDIFLGCASALICVVSTTGIIAFSLEVVNSWSS